MQVVSDVLAQQHEGSGATYSFHQKIEAVADELPPATAQSLGPRQ